MTRWLIGVDEAGRGPLAGPIAVGFVRVPEAFRVRKLFRGVADSKQLSEKDREYFYTLLQEEARAGNLAFCVRYSQASTIDRVGLTRAVRQATFRGVRALCPEPHRARVLLDGLLYAPREYEQETIIGGDDRVPLIMLASIVAKVRRDRLMRRLAKLYPAYEFEVHKGYATPTHRRVLQKQGLSEIHRRSFCQNLV